MMGDLNRYRLNWDLLLHEIDEMQGGIGNELCMVRVNAHANQG